MEPERVRTSTIAASFADLVRALVAEELDRRLPPRFFSVDEAARELGVGRTSIYALLGSGRLRSVRVGRRRLIPGDALREIVEGEK